jgi:hypothetical protein
VDHDGHQLHRTIKQSARFVRAARRFIARR